METTQYLTELSKNTDHIRNFCMVAHVDHGKTSLSDFLLASNGVLSEPLAGQVRFLDSREDEQERLITMKASSIALRHTYKDQNYLLHLVDSPGHIDFGSEVSTAIRVSDGAVIVVDLVDGVTMQTMSMLRQIFREGLSMVLVLNKIDLIITRLQLSPLEAYHKCRSVIEICNATLASYANQLEISEEHPELLNNMPEDNIWFSPDSGNVVFTSCLDGWAFRLEDFAQIYTKELKIDVKPHHLWGEHFYDAKKNAILDTPKRKDHPSMGMQMIFMPLWNLHEAFLGRERDDFTGDSLNKDLALSMSKKINVNPQVWDKPYSTLRMKLSTLLKTWLPLAKSVLDMICEHSNSPIISQRRRLPQMIPGFAYLPLTLKDALMNCTAINRNTNENNSGLVESQNKDDVPMVAFISKLLDTESLAGQMIGSGRDAVDIEDCFVGFARVYCGRVKRGQFIKLQTVTGETHCKIRSVYLLRGRGLEEVDAITAGCLCGIGGVTKHVIKYATISDDDRMLAMTPPRLSSTSIVRESIIPKNPADLKQLIHGLTLLNKVDPQVEILVLPTGEHVIGAAGEVHAERCVKDLIDTFACCELQVSEPLVSYRETIVNTGGKAKSITMSAPQGHFTITLHARALPAEAMKLVCDDVCNDPHDEAFMRRLFWLFKEGTEKKRWVEENEGKFWAWAPQKLRHCCTLLFDATSAQDEGAEKKNEGESGDSNNISSGCSISVCSQSLSFSESLTTTTRPLQRVNAEVLEDVEEGIIVDRTNVAYKERMQRMFMSAVVAGFQLATMSGLMADEPIMGVEFVVTKMNFDMDAAAESLAVMGGAGALAGQIMTCVKDACRSAMEPHGRRLVEPMYDCVVYSSGPTQGKIYGILSKRHAQIDDMIHEGSDLFYITCALPAANAFGLQDELRVATSGAATAQLRMARWTVQEEDPYYKPTTKEEVEENGVAVMQNQASMTLEKIRKRKGLHRIIIVEEAEKQKFSIRN